MEVWRSRVRWGVLATNYFLTIAEGGENLTKLGNMCGGDEEYEI